MHKTDVVTLETRQRWRELYRQSGGKFHGPHVEHASCEEQAFWRFVEVVHREAHKAGLLEAAAMFPPGLRDSHLYSRITEAAAAIPAVAATSPTL